VDIKDITELEGGAPVIGKEGGRGIAKIVRLRRLGEEEEESCGTKKPFEKARVEGNLEKRNAVRPRAREQRELKLEKASDRFLTDPREKKHEARARGRQSQGASIPPARAERRRGKRRRQTVLGTVQGTRRGRTRAIGASKKSALSRPKPLRP